MPNENDNTRLSVARRLTAVGAGVSMLLVALVAALVVNREHNTVVADSTISPPPSKATTSTAGLDTRAVVVERLKDILRIRDRAFHDRNPGILADVYTVDCPCLEGDRNAIKELAAKHYRLVGGETSIRVRRVKQVNVRLWLVVADFKSSALRIEANDGRLIRKEPEGKDLFQFSLSKPLGSHEWLLGRATAYQQGSR